MIDFTNEQILNEIYRDENLLKIYKALIILRTVDNKYITILPQLQLERLLLNNLGYVEDFETHKLIKIKG